MMSPNSVFLRAERLVPPVFGLMGLRLQICSAPKGGLIRLYSNRFCIRAKASATAASIDNFGVSSKGTSPDVQAATSSRQ